MKIALIRRNFTTIAPGGAERAASEIAFGLISRGHSITVLSEKFSINDDEKNTNLTWLKIPKKRSIFGGTYAFHKQVQKVISSLNLRDNHDIIFSLCRTYPVDVMRVTEQIHHIWLPMNYNKLQRFNPRHWSLLNLEKKLFLENKATHLVTISKLLKKQLIDNFNVNANNISIVYNGLDHQKFFSLKDKPEKLQQLRQQYNISDNKSIFIFVAHNFKIKGLSTILNSLQLLPNNLQQKFTLLIIGKDNSTPYLEKIKALKLTNCDIRFLGKQTNMPELYQISDLLVYPGSFETFGNVCTESMACGVPVITSPLVGASEIIKHDHNGYLLENYLDNEQLAKYLTEYLQLSSEKYFQMSNNSIATAKNFDWQKNVESFEKIFSKIAKDKI